MTAVNSHRKPWIGGNWKSFGTKAEVERWCTSLRALPGAGEVEVVVCPSAAHFSQSIELLRGSQVEVAAQNVSRTGPGAFTGEVNAQMLQDMGIQWTLVGHSERRNYFGETDQVIADKVGVALAAGLKTVICVGERLEERQVGNVDAVLTRQLEAVCPRISDWSKIVIAYEPVWAIGTGVVATPEQAETSHQVLRRVIQENAGEAVAKTVRIVYGGSVSEKNAEALIAESNIDGFLVGGASLKPEFNNIVGAVVAQVKKARP